MPVGEMLGRMSGTELVEWREFAKLEPIGYARGDMQAAMIMSMIANVNLDKEVHPEPFTALDFMPDWDGERQAAPEQQGMTGEETLALMRGAFPPMTIGGDPSQL